MPGPWDGPVRVVAATPTSFRLATLDGHLEAGQIELPAPATEDGEPLEFAIESWARAGDRLSHLLYNRLAAGQGDPAEPVGGDLPAAWPRSAGGRPRDGVHVDTRREDPRLLRTR